MGHQNRLFKDRIYEQLSRIGKGISSPKRLELLEILCQGKRTVEELARETNLTIANASQHLQVLRAARLVESQKEGLYVTYRLADQLVGDFLRQLRILAENRLAEIERITRDFLKKKDGMEEIDGETLWKRIREGTVTLLDVRPAEEYRDRHIKGSLSVPLKELESHLLNLSRKQEIVAYCRGPYCVLAVQAVEIMRKKGFKAFRLKDSVLDWEAKGFPVVYG
jgi:rhodanese-related sulfurtransferase/predicted transcriptional regulator